MSDTEIRREIWDRALSWTPNRDRNHSPGTDSDSRGRDGPGEHDKEARVGWVAGADRMRNTTERDPGTWGSEAETLTRATAGQRWRHRQKGSAGVAPLPSPLGAWRCWVPRSLTPMPVPGTEAHTGTRVGRQGREERGAAAAASQDLASGPARGLLFTQAWRGRGFLPEEAGAASKRAGRGRDGSEGGTALRFSLHACPTQCWRDRDPEEGDWDPGAGGQSCGEGTETQRGI